MRLWLVGGIALIVAILVLGWVVGISPALTEAAQSESDRVSVAAENEGYAADLEQLKAEYANLPELRGELDDLTRQVPTGVDMAGFLRMLDSAAAAAGVHVTTLKPSDPAVYIPATATVDPAVAPTPDPAATDDSASSDSSDTPAEPTTPVAPVSVGTGGVVPVDPADAGRLSTGEFYTMEVEIGMTGDIPAVMAMVTQLQKADRIFSVTAIVQEGGDAPIGTITGLVYIHTDPTGIVLRPADRGHGVGGVVPVAPTPTPTPDPTETPAPDPTETPAP